LAAIHSRSSPFDQILPVEVVTSAWGGLGLHLVQTAIERVEEGSVEATLAVTEVEQEDVSLAREVGK
jgi:hypothetical protein